LLEGYISPEADSIGRYTAPIGGAPVISNETPYSASLRCLGAFTSQRPVKVAVSQISDYTGKTESDGSGRKVTAGAALMAIGSNINSNINNIGGSVGISRGKREVSG